MTKNEAKKLSIGLYRLHWKTGGSDLAAVGADFGGNRWFVPVVWHTGIPSTDWKRVKWAERLPLKCEKEV